MIANFPRALALTLAYEGGWSDNPADPGGATMKGITLATYSAYIGYQATKDQLRHISDNDLEAIYRRNYWNATACDQFAWPVACMVFDCAVNSGPARAVKFLQKLVGVDPDGRMGPMTIAAVLQKPPHVLVTAYADMREAYLRSLPTFDTFGHGWINRIEALRAEAGKE